MSTALQVAAGHRHVIPPFDMGLIACYWLPLLKGVPVVAMSPFDWVRRPGMLLEVITRHHGTHCWLPNFAYNLIAQRVDDHALEHLDLSTMRAFVNCSEPIMVASHDAFRSRFERCGLKPTALQTSYALAENTFAVTHGGDDAGPTIDRVDEQTFASTGHAQTIGDDVSHPRTFVSSGRPLPETRIRILNDAGEPVAERTVGQIAIASPCLMQGYFNNDDATDQSVRDGWHVTGDLGYLAGDQLFVTGRNKDLIISGGKKFIRRTLRPLSAMSPASLRVAASPLDWPTTG